MLKNSTTYRLAEHCSVPALWPLQVLLRRKNEFSKLALQMVRK